MSSIYIPIFPSSIRNSMRKELVKCQKAAYYRYELGLQPVNATRVDLHAGAAFAKGMEAMRRSFYEQGKSASVAVQDGVTAVYAAYGNFACPPKSNKSADRMAGALVYYASEHPLEEERYVPLLLPSGSRAVEMSFSFPIGLHHPDWALSPGKELEYCGTMDALVEDTIDDGYWVMDEKTTSQMGDKWANQWLLDSQMTGYVWGARKLLKEIYPGLEKEVKGAIINGIAIRLHDYGSMRLPTYRAEWEIDRWFDQMRDDVARWMNAHLDGRHAMALDHACAYYNNPCDFAPLCSSRNPERLYDGSYAVERWNLRERA